MLLILIACAAFCATLAGGLFALRLRDKLHLILGFSAGAVIGVAFFDLVPEALRLGGAQHTADAVLTWTALGFLVYLLLDRMILFHGQAVHHHDSASAPLLQRGAIGAGSLSAHSMLDGVAIGIAFQASPAIGVVVAMAVLTHDFSDGINTVNVVLKNGGDRRQAGRWLCVDAVAPVVGIGLTYFLRLTQSEFSLALAIFAGFFLYIGASDLIPESYHSHPRALTTVMTLIGAAAMYAAVRLAQ